MPHYLIDINYKTVLASHLAKLQIMQNINNVPRHLHIFWLNFDKANRSFLHPFHLGENRLSKNCTWSFEWGTGAWVKMHRFNAFSRNVGTVIWKRFPTQVKENSTSILVRQNPKQFKEIWKDVSLRLILKNKGDKQHFLLICWFYPGAGEKGCIEKEDWGFSHFVLGFQGNSTYTLHLCFS